MELKRYVPRDLRDDGMIEAAEVAHYEHLTLRQYVLAADAEAQLQAQAAALADVTKERDAWKALANERQGKYESALTAHQQDSERLLIKNTDLKQQLTDAQKERDEACGELGVSLEDAPIGSLVGKLVIANRVLRSERQGLQIQLRDAQADSQRLEGAVKQAIFWLEGTDYQGVLDVLTQALAPAPGGHSGDANKMVEP